MKINIGPYTNWIGPYQIADKIFFWCEKYPADEKVFERWDYKTKEWLGEFLAHGFNKETPQQKKYFGAGRKTTWFSDLLSWIHSKQSRKISIKLDRWDTWNMDHTLALIILPMLKQLNDTKHGSPFTDDEDVPDNLKSTAALPKEHDWDTDNLHEARWDWIIGEMIWAFEQIVLDEEPDFWITEPQGMHSVKEEGSNLSELKWDVEGEMDRVAHKAYHDRIANGTRLFGKYYRAMWD